MKLIRPTQLALCTFALGALLTTASLAQTIPHDKLMVASEQALAAGKDALPGARSCFWARGPASADPYINIAYPDSNTYYWAAVFTIPVGAKLSLEGRFPHSRYMSFISYDDAGRPLQSVADYLIKPAAGSINPYVPGADRSTVSRDYALGVVDEPVDLKLATGMNLVGQTRDHLSTPKYGTAPGQQVILYRIYAGDKGTDETAGGGLPTPVLTQADGQVLKGAAACAALRTRQPLQLDPAAMAVPMNKYYELLSAAAKFSAVYPATNPPTWHQQLDREALYGIYTGTPPKAGARKSEGGFYPNLDNQYIRAIVNRKLGRVLVLRGKAPTTPKTFDGAATMGQGDLRYWSMCSNQGFANTRVNACVYDEQVPVGPDGYYTIVLSRAADRPRNATEKCGVAWLPMADDGDGAVDADVTVLQLRHMLGTSDFKYAIQGIGQVGDEAKDMGAYFPQGRYVSTSAFEIAVPCQVEKR